MEIKRLHDWRFNTGGALELQRRLAAQVLSTGEVVAPHFIAGVDVAAGRGDEEARASVVILSYPELELVAVEVARGILPFPYIPGLLSFRESPLIIDAFQRLACTPDLVIVDGQGTAHPRRMGIACHLGLWLDIPTIGCAKSRLCGNHPVLGDEAGSCVDVIDGGETIGAALRTKTGVKPVYVSTGHKISLENAVYWALTCCRGYRLPEPTRLAHLAAGGNLISRQNQGFEYSKVKIGDGRE